MYIQVVYKLPSFIITIFIERCMKRNSSALAVRKYLQTSYNIIATLNNIMYQPNRSPFLLFDVDNINCRFSFGPPA